jgi:hypothetical protein
MCYSPQSYGLSPNMGRPSPYTVQKIEVSLNFLVLCKVNDITGLLAPITL